MLTPKLVWIDLSNLFDIQSKIKSQIIGHYPNFLMRANNLTGYTLQCMEVMLKYLKQKDKIFKAYNLTLRKQWRKIENSVLKETSIKRKLFS